MLDRIGSTLFPLRFWPTLGDTGQFCPTLTNICAIAAGSGSTLARCSSKFGEIQRISTPEFCQSIVPVLVNIGQFGRSLTNSGRIWAKFGRCRPKFGQCVPRLGHILAIPVECGPNLANTWPQAKLGPSSVKFCPAEYGPDLANCWRFRPDLAEVGPNFDDNFVFNQKPLSMFRGP